MPPSDSGFQPNEKEAPEQSPRIVSGVSSCNQLFFTGGPNSYANGIFGVITFGR
jgi:hypothetical protein